MKRGARSWGSLGVYALAVLAVPWATVARPGESPGARAVSVVACPAARSQVDLTGVWSLHESVGEGSRVAFYYFHGDGHGLYRYGRVGYNNTHSFDYEVRGGTLELTFRKRGEVHRTGFEIGVDGTRQWLQLASDPRSSTPVRYFRQGGRVGEEADPPLSADDKPAGHMWLDHRKFATGGSGFGFYQFRPAGIDGRGTGWYHQGDFDDWSTEGLVYRIVGDHLELWFTLSGQHAITRFSVTPDEDGRDALWLESDPRDFWHEHRYRDAGRSFGTTPMLDWPQ